MPRTVPGKSEQPPNRTAISSRVCKCFAGSIGLPSLSVSGISISKRLMSIVEPPAAEFLVGYTEVREELQSRLRHHVNVARVAVDPATAGHFDHSFRTLVLVGDVDFDPLHAR